MNQVYWSPGMKISEVERLIIKAALNHFKGNKTATSISLGISVRTLDKRIEELKAEDALQAERVAKAQAEREDFLRRSRGIPSVPQYDTAVLPRVITR